MHTCPYFSQAVRPGGLGLCAAEPASSGQRRLLDYLLKLKDVRGDCLILGKGRIMDRTGPGRLPEVALGKSELLSEKLSAW